MAVAASVDDFDADVSMVNTVAEQLGPIDILVHNAGIASRGQAVEHTEPKEIQRVMATHAFAGHYLSQLVTPGMRAKGGGDIVVISSVATKALRGNGAPYNMAKSALEALARTLAKELRPDNIRVNIVAPGLVETEMGRRLMKARRRCRLTSRARRGKSVWTRLPTGRHSQCCPLLREPPKLLHHGRENLRRWRW